CPGGTAARRREGEGNVFGQVVLARGADVVRIPGTEAARCHGRRVRDGEGLAVEEGPAAAAGGEALIAARVDDHAELEATLHLEGDAHGEEGHAVGELRGAVEGIRDPSVTCGS